MRTALLIVATWVLAQALNLAITLLVASAHRRWRIVGRVLAGAIVLACASLAVWTALDRSLSSLDSAFIFVTVIYVSWLVSGTAIRMAAMRRAGGPETT